MCGMFSECYSLIQLDVSNLDISKVTNMSYMFWYCSNLTQLDLNTFDTSNVTDMCQMFWYCTCLNTIYVSNKWNVNNVADSNYMFYSCTNLPDYGSYKIDKTNAHYRKGGYLTLK